MKTDYLDIRIESSEELEIIINSLDEILLIHLPQKDWFNKAKEMRDGLVAQFELIYGVEFKYWHGKG